MHLKYSMDFIFVALLKDNDHLIGDQGHEFPACFIIEATSKSKALSWGGEVTFEHCMNNPSHELINTLVESPNNYSAHVLESLPRVKYGLMPTDEEIGW